MHKNNVSSYRKLAENFKKSQEWSIMSVFVLKKSAKIGKINGIIFSPLSSTQVIINTIISIINTRSHISEMSDKTSINYLCYSVFLLL